MCMDFLLAFLLAACGILIITCQCPLPPILLPTGAQSIIFILDHHISEASISVMVHSYQKNYLKYTTQKIYLNVNLKWKQQFQKGLSFCELIYIQIFTHT